MIDSFLIHYYSQNVNSRLKCKFLYRDVIHFELVHLLYACMCAVLLLCIFRLSCDVFAHIEKPFN